MNSGKRGIVSFFPAGSLFALPGGFAWDQKVVSAAWVYAGMCLLRERQPKIEAGSPRLLLRGAGCPGRAGKAACGSRLLPSSPAESESSDRERSEKILEATTYLDVRRPAYEPPAPPAPVEPLYDPGPEGKVRGTAPRGASSRVGWVWPLWSPPDRVSFRLQRPRRRCWRL